MEVFARVLCKLGSKMTELTSIRVSSHRYRKYFMKQKYINAIFQGLPISTNNVKIKGGVICELIFFGPPIFFDDYGKNDNIGRGWAPF